MAIHRLEVEGYRSVRELALDLKQVNVLVGPNGCGKSNLYRSMLLLSAAASGTLARSIAEEGGIASALWAGKRKPGLVRMRLGVRVGVVQYDLELGLQPVGLSAFVLDPEVKEETIRVVDGRKSVPVLERGTGTAWARDADGRRVEWRMEFALSESILSQLSEPDRFPHVALLRGEILQWRCYHLFRTDPDSPLHQPQAGTRTAIMAHDGRDVAAALRTILENGDDAALRQSVAEVFPGAVLDTMAGDGRFAVSLQMPGFQRPFTAAELSDGTLRYLCLLAALLSPRPPAVLALNEPETSLHPDLLPPLARLIARAARDSQVWLTTHSEKLAECIREETGATPIRLEKVDGETGIAGRGRFEFEEDEAG